jgi:hypothetical protein
MIAFKGINSPQWAVPATGCRNPVHKFRQILRVYRNAIFISSEWGRLFNCVSGAVDATNRGSDLFNKV